ncbi:MAG TPA: type II toxin-antitoxin system VapC family toxin [Candidatus Xenobia bacterium]
MKLLLDTHILLWWIHGDSRLSRPQEHALTQAVSNHDDLVVSDITLWEVAMLVGLKRIKLTIPVRDWLDIAVAGPEVQRQHITPAIAAQVAALPDTFHRDPADRILVSTALVLGLPLVTSDRRIIDSQLVPVIR